jgi:hypothetical protein
MRNMTAILREPRFDIREGHKSHKPFIEVKAFYDKEIDVLFHLLIDESLGDSIKFLIRKYLVVAIFAAMDFFFRNAARNLIDDNNLDVTPLFPRTSQLRLEKLIRENATTKGNGNIVASTYRFVDVYEIDFVFSHLLRMNSYLDYMIKQNDINQTRSVLDGYPIPIEYEKLTEAYKLRNDIAHDINPVNISKSRIIAIWDNFMNIMDLSQTVFLSAFDSDRRHSLDSDYEEGKKRAKRKAAYKLCSDKIMSRLWKKDQLTITYDEKFMINKIEGTYENKIIIDNVDRVIKKMLREELIEINEKAMNLTLKGEKRFKRTTNAEREKWRRELSEIVCSWIGKPPMTGEKSSQTSEKRIF